jgi:hypothetical protein
MANTPATSGSSQLQQLTSPSVGMPVARSYAAGLRRPAARDGTRLCVDWRSLMLRVEFQDVGRTVTIRLEGRFVGPYAEDTRDLVTRCRIRLRLVVNLSEVTFVDAVGEEMLSWLARIEGEFIADNCYPPPRLRTPAFADGAKTCRGRLPGNVARSRTF